MIKCKCDNLSIKNIVFIMLVAISILFVRNSLAGSINCGTGRTSIGGDYTVPPVNITAPNNGQTNTLLYSVNNAVVDAAYSDCRNGPILWINTAQTIMDIPAGEIYIIDGQTVYPTNIKGLGISITESFTGSNKPIPVWPSYVDTRSVYNNYWTSLTFNLKLWRTPGFIQPIGATQINSFTLVAFIRPTNLADTISSCPPGSIRLPGNNSFCGEITRRMTFTALFELGTCELLNPNQIVEMGTYHYTPAENASPWVDASFQIKCPQAYGYGGSVKNSTNYNDTNNGVKTANNGNLPVQIKVTPITPIVSPLQGTFKLSEGGAEGYDLQLAWGTPGSQGNVPAKPVPLGSWVNAYSLNSNYSSTPYAIGANALPNGADGKINMSARYLRNSQEINAGVANASVQVIATYQ